MTKKGLIVGSVILGSTFFLVTAFWVLFYSDYSANLNFIIPIRNSYQNLYWQVEGKILTPKRSSPPFNPIYTIQVVKPFQDGYYTYSLWGTISDVDLANHLFYVNGYGKNKYVFDIKSYGYEYRTSVQADKIDPFAKGGSIQASWQDKRSLMQIKKDYLKNKQLPLNQDSPTGLNFIGFY